MMKTMALNKINAYYGMSNIKNRLLVMWKHSMSYALITLVIIWILSFIFNTLRSTIKIKNDFYCVGNDTY